MASTIYRALLAAPGGLRGPEVRAVHFSGPDRALAPACPTGTRLVNYTLVSWRPIAFIKTPRFLGFPQIAKPMGALKNKKSGKNYLPAPNRAFTLAVLLPYRARALEEQKPDRLLVLHAWYVQLPPSS